MAPRLWDKGEPLDARVLRYTAGEDHRLDERLVPYDVRGSIAHARMLHQQKLLANADFDAICVQEVADTRIGWLTLMRPSRARGTRSAPGWRRLP